jgi:hypothetical protein
MLLVSRMKISSFFLDKEKCSYFLENTFSLTFGVTNGILHLLKPKLSEDFSVEHLSSDTYGNLEYIVHE